MRGATYKKGYTSPWTTFQSTRPMRGATRSYLRLLLPILFQSTRPMRGATIWKDTIHPALTFQSTRPVWGATRLQQGCGKPPDVSIHAPRVGRDPGELTVQITLSVSIHAPRVGRDGNSKRRRIFATGFNPRAPCGARRRVTLSRSVNSLFQSTRPVRGATLPSRFYPCRRL